MSRDATWRGRGRELLLVLVSALLSSGGLLMVVSGEDRRTGIGVLAFFALCLAVAIWLLVSKRTVRKSLAARSVEIVGSVPFRVKVGRGALLLGVVTAVMAVVAWAASGFAAVVAGATAALCAALVPVVLFGPPSRRAVVFEPEGLRFVEARYAVRVPWDEIADARILDVGNTLVVALTLRDPARLTPTPRARREDPSTALRRLSRAVSMNRALYGCDVSIGPATHGLDAVLFLRAVETYVFDPGARPKLARKALDAA